MAEEIVGVKIQVDATDMNKSVGDLRKKIVETEAEVKRLKDTYGETSKEAIEGQKQLAKLQEITNKKIEQQNERLDNAAKTIGALSAAYGGVQGALELTGLAGEDTIKQLAKIQSALAIGDAIQNLSEFRGAITKTFSSFGSSIKKTFSTLRSGLIATGIGAFVVALGLIAANFDTVKKVVLNLIPGLGKVADFIGNIINKVTDFIGVTSEAERATARLIANNEKAIKDGERFLDLNADKYDEYTQRKIKANIEYKKKENEFLGDQKLSEDEKNKYIKEARDKADREIAKSTDDRNKAVAESNKKLSEQQKAQNEKDAQKQKEIADKIEADRIQAEKDKIDREDAARKVELDAFRATLTERNQEELALEDEYEEKRKTLIRAGIYDFAKIDEEKRLALLEIADKYQKIEDEKEQKRKDEQKTKDEEALKIAQANKDLELEYQNRTAKTIEEKRVAELAQLEEDYARKIALAQKNGEDIVNLEKLKSLSIAEINKKADEDEKKLKKAKFDSELDMASQTLSIVGGLVDQNSATGKAIAVTQAIINTYQGASKAIAQGGIFGPVAAAATIAAGLINVKKIISTKIPSASGAGSVSGGSASVSLGSAPISPTSPIQNTVTQLDQSTINRMGSAAGRAYVVESDITNSQEKIVRINRAARLA